MLRENKKNLPLTKRKKALQTKNIVMTSKKTLNKKQGMKRPNVVPITACSKTPFTGFRRDHLPFTERNKEGTFRCFGVVDFRRRLPAQWTSHAWWTRRGQWTSYRIVKTSQARQKKAGRFRKQNSSTRTNPTCLAR